jgi:N-alpha-acetyl-L-2,4-diaminobutyrate deacetylase
MPDTTAAPYTRVIADIDLEGEGKRFGALRIPHSRDDSGWGTVAIPVTVVRNGPGPTLLLTAGTHGDEYEGQIALLDLARALEPGEIRGRVIIVPAHHFPACLAGTRTSPIDGKDVNRTFPGDARGSFAQILSHYVTNFLLPQVDAVMDVHSGGRSLDCLPCTMSHILDDTELTERVVAFARAFGAPMHIMSREVDGSGTFQAACEARRLVSMSSEMGGGNRVQLRGLRVTEIGVRNLMKHLGIMAGTPAPSENPTRLMLLPDHDCYHFAPIGGVYRPFHELGAEVTKGEPAAAIYDISDPSRSPRIMHYKRSGLLWGTRGQGRIEPGDSSCVVIVPAQP